MVISANMYDLGHRLSHRDRLDPGLLLSPQTSPHQELTVAILPGLILCLGADIFASMYGRLFSDLAPIADKVGMTKPRGYPSQLDQCVLCILSTLVRR